MYFIHIGHISLQSFHKTTTKRSRPFDVNRLNDKKKEEETTCFELMK